MFHFPKLILGNALLQGKQILGLDAVCFIQDLSPAVFTSCFCSKKYQLISRKQYVMVSFSIGKQEIGLFIVFCYDLFFVLQLCRREYGCKVMFQGFACTGFATVKNDIREFNQFLTASLHYS